MDKSVLSKKVTKWKNKAFLFVFLLSLCTAMVVAQQGITVSGTVTDDFDDPLPGVNVRVKGTSIGMITDANGRFQLNVPNAETILVFSYVGFVTVEIPLNGRNTLNVTMT